MCFWEGRICKYVEKHVAFSVQSDADEAVEVDLQHAHAFYRQHFSLCVPGSQGDILNLSKSVSECDGVSRSGDHLCDMVSNDDLTLHIYSSIRGFHHPATSSQTHAFIPYFCGLSTFDINSL